MKITIMVALWWRTYRDLRIKGLQLIFLSKLSLIVDVVGTRKNYLLTGC